MTMHHIASFSPSGGSGYFAFNSIPQTYTHLQLRVFARSTFDRGSGNTVPLNTFMSFNGDAGSNYGMSRIFGNGSAVSSAVSTPNTTQLPTWETIPGVQAPANTFGVGIIDILDYSSSTKFKTSRTISGVDQNGSGVVGSVSSVWASTNPITIVGFSIDGSWVAGSRIDLYGITINPIATGA